jgi:hypothetical protein
MSDYSTYEAATILGLDEATVRRRCADGRMPGAYLQKVRRRQVWRIPERSLLIDRDADPVAWDALFGDEALASG